MKISRHQVITLSLIIVMSACSVAPIPENMPYDGASSSNEESGAAQGKLEVCFSEEMADLIESAYSPVETKSADFNVLAAELGIKSMQRIFKEAGEFEPRHRAAGLHRFYIVEYEKSVSLTKASDEIMSMPGVDAVSPLMKKKRHRQNFFNDPYFPMQWNLTDINVLPVWQKYTSGSRDVIVAVIDGGMMLQHRDLKSSSIPYNGNAEGKTNMEILGSGSASFMDIDGDGLYDGPVVSDDHGCNVGSVIGATSNNGAGISGIAGGSDGTGGVRLLSCEIFRGDESGSAEDALVYAADHGAVIANNSWGFEFEDDAEAKLFQESFEKGRAESALKSAIDYFIDYAGTDVEGNQIGPMKGGVAVFSAGNDSFSYSCPGGYSRVIGTAAMKADFKLASYSNYGPWVDVVAPGGEGEDYTRMIIGCDATGRYCAISGTSPAASHVSAVAALIVSYFGGSGFTNEMLVERLLGGLSYGVLKNDEGVLLDLGVLDAAAAFEYDPDQSLGIRTAYDGNYMFKSHETVKIHYSVVGNAKKAYEVVFAGDCPATSAKCSTNSVDLTINCLEAQPGDYTAAITVGAGTSEEVVYPIVFTILPNTAPQVISTIPDLVLDGKGGIRSYELDKLFVDRDGETLQCNWSLSGFSEVVSVTLNSGRLNVRAAGYGYETICIEVKDARGERASISFQVVARDSSKDEEGSLIADIYPNPCTDLLYVRPLERCSGQISLVGINGAGAFSRTFTDADMFHPALFNVKDLPSGRYIVTVNSEGREISRNLVKL